MLAGRNNLHVAVCEVIESDITWFCAECERVLRGHAKCPLNFIVCQRVALPDDEAGVYVIRRNRGRLDL